MPDRVFDQVLGNGAEHPAAKRDEDRLVGEPQLQPDAGRLGALDPLRDHSAKDRRSLRLAERDDLTALLELAQEENVVYELRHLIDLGSRLPEKIGEVGPRELGGFEQRHEPRERRA